MIGRPVTGVTMPERASATSAVNGGTDENAMDWSDRVPGLLARLSTVLSIIGGLTTAALGPAFIWRFALHHRPGERIGLWFGFLAAALLAGALRPCGGGRGPGLAA
jgi:hypothetical protein